MWNYRILKSNEESYGLYEVIYNDDGKISAHTASAEVEGESPEDILSSLRLMLDDAQKSYYNVLDMDSIEFAPLHNEDEKFESIALEDLERQIKEDINNE
jgi:metal-responsive CopG/Arc/MetJ family transcriptional regulator